MNLSFSRFLKVAYSSFCLCGLSVSVFAESISLVNNGSTVTIPLAGVPAGGSLKYTGTHQGNGYKMEWNFQKANTAASFETSTEINGFVSVLNQTNEEQDFSLTLNLDLLEATLTPLTGGLLTAKLIANADGGKLSCPENAEFMARIYFDDKVENTFYWCPFTMTGTGAGSLATNNSYGMPAPSYVSPQSLATKAARRYNFRVTGGDKVIFSEMNLIAGNRACLGDLDLTGIVDSADIGKLIGDWGSDADLSDLNGDGLVNGFDLPHLLSSYGVCP